MATYKGVNRTLADTPEGSNIMDPGVQKGKVRVIMDTYEANAIAAGSIIEMGELLPKGARVLEIVMMHDALGAAIIDIGDYEDDNRYNNDVDVSVANIVDRIDLINGRQYEVVETTPGATTTDRQIILTTANAAITGTIKIEIYYTQE